MAQQGSLTASEGKKQLPGVFHIVFFSKNSTIDVWLGFEYSYEMHR